MIAHGAPQICRAPEFGNMLCTRTILGLSSNRLNSRSLTSTKSLPTKTYVTVRDCFHYIFQLARGISARVQCSCLSDLCFGNAI
jgi:hypothetical protein